jgi:hypothetical protein
LNLSHATGDVCRSRSQCIDSFEHSDLHGLQEDCQRRFVKKNIA